MTNEKPILFKPEMVRAVISGKKTQTRRTSGLDAINEDPSEWELEGRILCSGNKKDVGKYSFTEKDGDGSVYLKCPYGEVGDRLWVKESWAPFNCFGKEDGVVGMPLYRATFPPSMKERHDAGMINDPPRWRSPRFMPRNICRLVLEIVDIRVERLQDITEEDAIAEGVTVHLDAVMAGAVAQDTPARMEFWSLWNSIHNKDGLGWDRNPFVWVVTFKQFVHPTWKVEYGEMEEVKG